MLLFVLMRFPWVDGPIQNQRPRFQGISSGYPSNAFRLSRAVAMRQSPPPRLARCYVQAAMPNCGTSVVRMTGRVASCMAKGFPTLPGEDVHRVYDTIGNAKDDWSLSRAREVISGLYAFDYDQPVAIQSERIFLSACRGPRPGSRSPCPDAARLIAEIGADDARVVDEVTHHRFPSCPATGLRIGATRAQRTQVTVTPGGISKGFCRRTSRPLVIWVRTVATATFRAASGQVRPSHAVRQDPDWPLVGREQLSGCARPFHQSKAVSQN